MFSNIFKRKTKYKDIDPEEIFLDSENLPEFNQDQFEGRIEKPLASGTLFSVSLVFILIGTLFAGRVWDLQVAHGAAYEAKSENNSLKSTLVFANRGEILDRNGVPIVWNDLNPNVNTSLSSSTSQSDSIYNFPLRMYATSTGLDTTLGYVNYPAKDNAGNYYQTDIQGADGLEKIYDTTLSGQNGQQLTETNALGKVVSQSVVVPPVDGQNLTLSIDSGIESEMYKAMLDFADKAGYQGGAALMMDVHTGELISMASFPMFDSNVISLHTDSSLINSYLNNKNNPFLNRPIAGLYTPGSIMKPYVALGALTEHIIDPSKIIVSTGSISVPNPYDPTHPTIFKDWKALGPVDIRHALAMSSDVYFYEVGGGFQNPGGSYQPGLGIANIEKYMRMFGFGSTTGIRYPGEENGIISDPAWKAANFGGEGWRLGDTYHTAIGQYGTQVTPLQAVRAVAAIANGGTLLTPTIIKPTTASQIVSKPTGVDQTALSVVQQGMRLAVNGGIITALNVPYVAVSAKSGTAQVGIGNSHVNSWITGFFPSDHPRYAFAIVMQAGVANNEVGASLIMREVLDWMEANRPGYFQ